MQRIKKIVCEYYNVEPHELDLKNRKAKLVECRQMCQTFAYMYSEQSLERIGISIGGQKHVTVLYSVKTIKKLYDSDKYLRKRYEFLNGIFSEMYKEVDRSNEAFVIRRQINNAKYNLYLVSKLPNIDKELIQNTITYLESL